MRDLIPCLILRRSQIELQIVFRTAGISTVWKNGAFGVAGDAFCNRVGDGGGIGEVGFELEVDFANGIGYLEDVVG